MANTHSVDMHHLTHTGPAGTTSAVVVPAWGANIVGFSFQAPELMWPVSVLEPADIATVALKPTSFGAPLLAPTPGRVGSTVAGAFTYDGREYRMVQPRHGFLRHLPWTVVDRAPHTILCALDVRPAEALGSFPFEFRAEYRVTISERRLDCRLTFRSTSSLEQPVSAGWHPYLYREPKCRLRIPASSLWESEGSVDPVPNGRRLPVAGASDFRAGRELGEDEAWDQAFTDLATEGAVARSWLESETVVTGRDGMPKRLGVSRIVEASPVDGATAGLPTTQLYTAPGRPAVAVEPFSSPPNALNLLADGQAGTNVHRLGRNEEVAFHMGLLLSLRYL
jgi:galactose mutarotase-like enzyme